jgi:glucokinase
MRGEGLAIGAVDLGGTKILSLVVDQDGAVLGEDMRPTEAASGPDAVIGRIVDSMCAAMERAGVPVLAAMGIAAPGPIDFERGLITAAPNLPGWRNVPVAARLGDRFGCPAVLENDANAAALGEFAFGAGRGARHLVYLTISTGIGGGLVLDGRLYRGADGAAGEVGHIPLLPDGPACGCGAHGCLEALASGTAIARRARELLLSGHATGLRRLSGRDTVTAEQVHEAAERGDTDARAVIEDAGRYLGRGLATIVNLFNPHVIVLGGGTAKIGPMLLEPAHEELRAHALRLPLSRVRVVSAALGDRAGALGVAALARSLVAAPPSSSPPS